MSAPALLNGSSPRFPSSPYFFQFCVTQKSAYVWVFPLTADSHYNAAYMTYLAVDFSRFFLETSLCNIVLRQPCWLVFARIAFALLCLPCLRDLRCDIIHGCLYWTWWTLPFYWKPRLSCNRGNTLGTVLAGTESLSLWKLLNHVLTFKNA